MSDIRFSRRTVLGGAAMALAMSDVPTGAAQYRGVYLTYDDGPDPRLTPHLLDALAVYGMRATFFVVGRQIAGSGHLLNRMVNEGHMIGNHSWSHVNMQNLSLDQILTEIDHANDAIASHVGFTPPIFRPPYGALPPGASKAITQARGMSTVLWTLDTNDWRDPGADEVARRVVTMTRPGSVVLMHDVHAGTVAAAPAAYQGLLDRGMISIPLS